MPQRNAQFETIATCYEHSLPLHVVEHYLSKRARFLRERWGRPLARVLDVGAGTGLLAARLAEQQWQVAGLDTSAAMLKIAAQRGVPVVQSSGVHLPFSDNTFDVVYCVAVLHHIAEPQAVRTTIREMWRVTRPRGVTVYWDHNPLNPYWPIIMARVPQDTGEERLIGLSEIQSALQNLPTDLTSYSSGFIGDFVPARLLGVFQACERIVEGMPGVRRIVCAHNVVVARKRSA